MQDFKKQYYISKYITAYINYILNPESLKIKQRTGVHFCHNYIINRKH